MSSIPLRPETVPGVPLSALAATAAATIAGAEPSGQGAGYDPVITGATLRAQQVLPGDLFAALPGSRVHGAEFAADAVAAGAAAILTDADGAARYLAAAGSAPTVPVLVTDEPRQRLGPVAAQVYGDPSSRLPVIGVTGTSGKTTSCFLLAAALAAQGLVTGLIGTVTTRIAGYVLPSAFTTPEAPDLQALLAVMVERGVQAVAMEVSSHALSLGRVAGTRYAVGAFTNLTQDHLDFHGDMESYFAAKATLFDGRSAAAVIDVDGEYGARLAARHPAAVTVSTQGADAHWRIERASSDDAGRQRAVILGPDGRRYPVTLGIPGTFNLANALIAVACVEAAGFDAAVAAEAMSTVQVPGRMQRVDAGQDFLAVVDYAHKPAALAAVLEAVRGSVPGRVILVVGAGGDRDVGKRPMMGEVGARLADVLIVTDDNPRSEDPAAIRSAVLAGASGDGARAQVHDIGGRRAAISAAVAAARTGDAVIIAGKGHETGQEINGVVHPFSDLDELLAALAGRSGGRP